MTFWSVMNWVAWGLCAVIVFYLAFDVFKVEKEFRAKKKNGKKAEVK